MRSALQGMLPKPGNVANAATANLATEQATTSGTSVTFTNIPAGVTEVTVHVVGFSTNGTSGVRIRIGPVAGVETTGYRSGRWYTDTANVSNAGSSTAGFDFFSTFSNARIQDGHVTLKLEDASDNTWTAFGALYVDDSTDFTEAQVGAKSIAGPLSALEVTTIAGNTFDAGAVNISWRF